MPLFTDLTSKRVPVTKIQDSHLKVEILQSICIFCFFDSTPRMFGFEIGDATFARAQ